jgi:hypothetical protein
MCACVGLLRGAGIGKNTRRARTPDTFTHVGFVVSLSHNTLCAQAHK